MSNGNKAAYLRGIRDGLPIAAGYFAVSFALGIYARQCGLTAAEATLSSLLTNASAGEYQGFKMIAAASSVWMVILMTTVINARYLLMSCALCQKLSPSVPLWQRLLLGDCVTDEIFAISAAYPGSLNPVYSYGAFSVASPGWALGTLLGVVMGNVLPANVVNALGVGLYGMFIAIIVPPAKENRVVAGVVILAMLLSFIASHLSFMTDAMSVLLITVGLSAAAALLFPVKEEEKA